jgi:hypothetical protein
MSVVTGCMAKPSVARKLVALVTDVEPSDSNPMYLM